MEAIFEKENGQVKVLKYDGGELIYRAFEGISYVEKPAAPELQILNLFVPEKYYDGESLNGYTLKTAPIFMPNSVGGYMPGPAGAPWADEAGRPDTMAQALLHGYVAVSPGLRGRGMKNAAGEYIGMAPAAICDYKAAVRFLRSQAASAPGDVEKIISNGTSAGGAMSALLGATGNHPDYEPYLEEMGAARERDDIFAASCYCPITNLEHADMAYEWEFDNLWDCHWMQYVPPQKEGEVPQWIPKSGRMSEEQITIAKELRKMFPVYVEGLKLKTEQGEAVLIDEQGGILQDCVCEIVCQAAQKALEQGIDLSQLEWLKIESGKVTGIDYRAYIAFRTRLKGTPAFDSTDLHTPENELFGSKTEPVRHFTAFGQRHSKAAGTMAGAKQIKMMNPMEYIGDANTTLAKHFRIRHGAIDRDTSLFISALLTIALRNAGAEADLAYPWGKWHMGDYDLDELFAWIDGLILKK